MRDLATWGGTHNPVSVPTVNRKKRPHFPPGPPESLPKTVNTWNEPLDASLFYRIRHSVSSPDLLFNLVAA